MGNKNDSHHRHHRHHHHHWHSNTINNNNTSSWSSITYNTLKSIPEYYPLSIHSYIVIKLINKNILNNVIIYIKECLQKCSIITIFDDKKAIAWCESEDHVRFTIRLFLTSNNNNKGNKDNKESVLIEIQRFDGCAIRFHTYSRFILNYVNSKIMKKEKNSNDTAFTTSTASTNKKEIAIPKI